MPRGRPRKATNVLELTGRLRTNPDRRTMRAGEPVPTGHISTTPPKWMTKGQKKCYREIVRGCAPNVLTSSDGVIVEITACLLDEYREDPRLIKPAKMARLVNCLGQLGMSPTDRSKASTLPTPKENPFAKFAS